VVFQRNATGSDMGVTVSNIRTAYPLNCTSVHILW
jgi:hypothetical protein